MIPIDARFYFLLSNSRRCEESRCGASATLSTCTCAALITFNRKSNGNKIKRQMREKTFSYRCQNLHRWNAREVFFFSFAVKDELLCNRSDNTNYASTMFRLVSCCLSLSQRGARVVTTWHLFRVLARRATHSGSFTKKKNSWLDVAVQSF